MLLVCICIDVHFHTHTHIDIDTTRAYTQEWDRSLIICSRMTFISNSSNKVLVVINIWGYHYFLHNHKNIHGDKIHKYAGIFNIYILSGFSLIIFFASFCQYVHGFCFSVCECCNNRLPLHAGTSKRTFRTCRWVITIINRSLMLSISMLESNEI